MAAKPASGSTEELASSQRKRAEALVARFDADGEARLDGTPASLERLDTLLVTAREPVDAADHDRLAELVGAYAGEVLLRDMPGRWVLDGTGLPAVELAGRARVRVTRRAQRELRGEGDGMAALYARVRETVDRAQGAEGSTAGTTARADPDVAGARTDLDAAATPADASPVAKPAGSPAHAPAPPLGEDRPLGLRRSAFRNGDGERASERATDQSAEFRRLAADVGRHTRSGGFGPSLFVWFLILCLVALIAWAAYTYRNAPP